MQDITLTENQITDLTNLAVQIIVAVLVLIIGWIIIGRILSLIRRIAIRKDLDPTLTSFLLSIASITLKLIVLVTFIQMLGIETTSLLAVMAAASFAVGLALQGSLSNFAGGVLIIFFKPYVIGDYIEAQGHAGSVKSIQIFNTILTTPDNKTIIIPNGSISNGSITNYSSQDRRRVDFVFGIGYDDDFEKAKDLIKGLISKDKRILKDPEHLVRVKELGASSVDIVVRVWVEKSDYWAVHFDMIENVKSEFDKNSVSFPFPQTDVHLYKES